MTNISIITVCFNSVATIRDTIESVLAQDYPGIEYVIVDGGSTDGTMDIVHEYRGHISRIISEPDQGIYDAMNKGIRMVTGNVIGMLNSDDFYADKYVLQQVASVFRDESIMVCYADMCYVSSAETKKIVRYWKSEKFRPGAFKKGWCPPHPTFFVRRVVYERYGSFDPKVKIAADAELMMRFLECHCLKTAYIPEILVHMRLGGTTNRSLTNIWRQNLEIWRALKDHQLRPSMVQFVSGKLISRVRQYLSRPLE